MKQLQRTEIRLNKLPNAKRTRQSNGLDEKDVETKDDGQSTQQ